MRLLGILYNSSCQRTWVRELRVSADSEYRRIVLGVLRYGAWTAFAVAGALGCAPIAAGDPSSLAGQPADAAVADLQAQGYNVSINWITGYDTKPLSDCWVTSVNDPGHLAPTDGTFTTVYVDVACPNGDDGGFRFGGGIG